MAQPAAGVTDPDRMKTPSLPEITKPVQHHLEAFRLFFRDAVDTDVILLDQIIRYLLRQKGQESRPTLVFMTARMFGDRKSTRLNSSHVAISYAVRCLNNKSSHPG